MYSLLYVYLFNGRYGCLVFISSVSVLFAAIGFTL